MPKPLWTVKQNNRKKSVYKGVKLHYFIKCMSDKAAKRIVPLSLLTAVIFSVLGILEVLIVFGVLEIKAESVRKVMPAAYMPFIKLVGEHTETRPAWAVSDADVLEEEAGSGSAMADAAGMAVTVDTNTVQKILLEPTTPANETEPAGPNEGAPVG
jgi:hypothetical protein